jgi:hypothetical protein
MSDARDIEIRIGDAIYRGRLPLMGDRERVVSAKYVSLGYRPGDDSPSEAAIPADAVLAEIAALGLCWPDSDPLGIRSLRDHRRDVIAYADEVYDALRSRGLRARAILEAAHEVYGALVASIPTESEVQAALDPTEAPAAPSTSATS